MMDRRGWTMSVALHGEYDSCMTSGKVPVGGSSYSQNSNLIHMFLRHKAKYLIYSLSLLPGIDWVLIPIMGLVSSK